MVTSYIEESFRVLKLHFFGSGSQRLEREVETRANMGGLLKFALLHIIRQGFLENAINCM